MGFETGLLLNLGASHVQRLSSVPVLQLSKGAEIRINVGATCVLQSGERVA